MNIHHSLLDFCFRSTHLQSRFSGNYLSRLRANSGDFHELRPYVIGEESSRIDYRKSLFEENRLIVREYTQEKSYEACMVFCIDPSWRFGTRELTKLDILSEAVMLLCESVWAHELQGSILLIGEGVSQDGILEYPFPKDSEELRQFFGFLKKMIHATTKEISQIKCSDFFAQIAAKKEQKGIILFGEYLDESMITEHLCEFQVVQISLIHPAEWQISQELNIPRMLLDGPITTSYGSQLILSQPEQIGMALQTAFHLW